MAQVYKRIANPYMPQGTPDKTNAPSPFYAPGELGCYFDDQNTGNQYLRAQLDSGATSSTGVGAVAAGQVAYWKNQGLAIVTNDKAQCDLGPTASINRVAGIFQLAVTTAPGVKDAQGNPVMYMCDLVVKAQAYPVLGSSAPTAGGFATVNTAASTANCISTAAGTAAPSQIIGVWASATAVSGSLYPCDVNVGFAD